MHLAHLNVGALYELLHVKRSLLGCCVLLELHELLDEVLVVLALENDAEDELHQDKQLVDILLLDQFIQVNNVVFEGSHATHGFLVRAEPELHLR